MSEFSDTCKTRHETKISSNSVPKWGSNLRKYLLSGRWANKFADDVRSEPLPSCFRMDERRRNPINQANSPNSLWQQEKQRVHRKKKTLPHQTCLPTWASWPACYLSPPSGFLLRVTDAGNPQRQFLTEASTNVSLFCYPCPKWIKKVVVDGLGLVFTCFFSATKDFCKSHPSWISWGKSSWQSHGLTSCPGIKSHDDPAKLFKVNSLQTLSTSLNAHSSSVISTFWAHYCW
jgi:hypothetical protein